MPDKIVNHFVLADGSIAKYDAEQLAGNVPEVVDIRTGYDGTIYESAGDAVRGQVEQILDVLDLEQYDYFMLVPSMLEKGFYNDSGVKQSHSTRWRTKSMIKINAGDILHGNKASNNFNFDPYFKIEIFNTAKVHTSTLAWAAFDTYINGYEFLNDGFILLSMQDGQNVTQAADFNGYISIARMTTNIEQQRRYINNFGNIKEGPIGLDFIEYGYWNAYASTDFPKHYSSNRACVAIPIPVKAGDEIHPTNKNVLFDIGQSKTSMRSYYNTPYHVNKDGFVYINFKNADNSAVTLSSFANSIRLVKNSDKIVETVKSDELMNGYFDAADNYAIKGASHRVLSYDGIYCHKGDHVRINLDDIAAHFYEFDNTNTVITRSSVYYSKSTINFGYIHIGDYIIQNDCWLKAQFYKISDQSASINPADYNGAYSVIHMADEVTRFSNGENRFPKSPKKPRIIGTNNYAEMQDGTIINDKLWMDMDDYNGNHWFSIVNLETGAIEKTIPHTLGHGNSIDYNQNNDTLLFTDIYNNRAYLFAHPTGNETAIAPADCLTISFNRSDCIISSLCWGEDNQTIYNMLGYDSTEDETFNICHKIILTMSNGTYTGAYTIMTTYKMDIQAGVNTVFGGNEMNYTQGATYDGYIYMGYGTRRMNYLVLDLDDNTGIASVVGNYYYPLFTVDRVNQIMEPELIALYGGKVIIGSREWNDKRSFLAEFEK